jgi:hypothetical protein
MALFLSGSFAGCSNYTIFGLGPAFLDGQVRIKIRQANQYKKINLIH